MRSLTRVAAARDESIVTAWPKSTSIRWDDTHRLILAADADASEPILGALVEDEDDLVAVIELAAATNSRLAAQSGMLLGAIDVNELLFEVPFSKIVNAAFTYPNPSGGRFSAPDRGAWYAARAVRTSIVEVAYHYAVHLAETDWWEAKVDYQDYVSDIRSDGFADLADGDQRSLACLRADSYVKGQQLAERLLGGSWSGVVYPSVRDLRGRNVACFRPALVSNVRLGGRYRLEWIGKPKPKITMS